MSRCLPRELLRAHPMNEVPFMNGAKRVVGVTFPDHARAEPRSHRALHQDDVEVATAREHGLRLQ